MLTDKQSLILCGVLGVGVFSTGVLNILDNFITKTVLTILFLVIVANLIIANSMKKGEKE